MIGHMNNNTTEKRKKNTLRTEENNTQRPECTSHNTNSLTIKICNQHKSCSSRYESVIYKTNKYYRTLCIYLPVSYRFVQITARTFTYTHSTQQ